ncbi:MAG: hypothetical protein REH83_04615 [Rickettsiella sp.]|nr:hypothetical protein [Rickettsiella sp.]
MKKEISKWDHTDPELHQELNLNTVHIKVSETKIPTSCNKKLILDYLEKICSKEQNYVFYVLENKILVYCPNFDENELLEDPFNIMRQYLESGECLANLNKREVISEGAFLLSIAFGSLIVILLSVFVPSVAFILPAIVVPLLIIAIFVSIILFCSVSLPKCVEILAAKQEFHECEKRLTNILSSIQQTSQAAKYLNPTITKASPINIPPNNSRNAFSTSGVNRGFFAERCRYFDSFESIEEDQLSLSCN